jgi:RNA polymerase sigma factor (TIGR02999 family)
MSRERRDHTLSPTALVHEAYVRLIDQTRVDGSDRARFLAIASRAMRQILVEHARARNAQKRGKGWRRVTVETGALGASPGQFDAIALDDALAALARVDERAAAVTEMRVFGGLTHDEIADVLGVSRRTVDGDWALARRWLSREMGHDG